MQDIWVLAFPLCVLVLYEELVPSFLYLKKLFLLFGLSADRRKSWLIVDNLGLNKVKSSWSALGMLLHWSVSPPPPPITFDDFRDPPTMSSFSKQIWVVPTSESFECFQWSPFLFSKNQGTPPPPPRQAINNDWSTDRSLRMDLRWPRSPQEY